MKVHKLDTESRLYVNMIVITLGNKLGQKTACGLHRVIRISPPKLHEVRKTWRGVNCKNCLKTKKR